MAAALNQLASFHPGLLLRQAPAPTPQRSRQAPRTAQEGISAFAPLTFTGWSALEGVGERKQAPPRQELFGQDEAAPPVFFVESGVVKLVRNTQNGEELITGLRSSGWLLDGASAVLGLPSTCKAVTVTPCVLRCLSRAAFMKVLDVSPNLLKEVNGLICRELCAGQEQQVAFRCGDAQSRLEMLVNELSPNGAIGSLDQLPLKRMEIAQLLAITPEHLSRLAKQITFAQRS